MAMCARRPPNNPIRRYAHLRMPSAHQSLTLFTDRFWHVLRLFALATTAACSGDTNATAASQPSHLFADYEVIEVSAYSLDTSSSLWPGTIIRLSDDEISVYREPSAWARMPVEWLDRSDEEQLVGAYRRSGDVELHEANGFLSIVENGHEVALAARNADRLALEALDALPSLISVQNTARACLDAYGQAFPDDVEMLKLDPKSFGSTSSARAVAQLAALRLARTGMPIPASCEQLR